MIADWINVADAEREDEAKLEQGPRDYFAGGAGAALRENAAARGHWRLRPRVLRDVREVSPATEVRGKPVEIVLVAPVAYQRLAHPEAESGMAAGAAAAGTVLCLSTLSTARPAEEVAGRATLPLDGGIRPGVDVPIALSLGTDAVLVGRPALWGLAAGGREGGAAVLGLLRAELELTLGLSGCTSPADLSAADVRRAPITSVYSV